MSPRLLRRWAGVSFLSLVLAVATSALAHAGWPITVGEDLVLSQPAGHGKELRWLIPDPAGGVYVGWLDHATSETFPELRILRLDASGGVAAGWPAGGLLPPRAGGYSSGAALAPDGSGGLYGAWAVGNTALQRLALVRIGPDGTLAPGWPTNVDLAYGSGSTSAFQNIGIVADPEGVYVSWSDNATRLERRRFDGALATGWNATGTVVNPVGAITLISDGGTGVFAAWQDTAAWVRHLTAVGTPAPGWSTEGVHLRLAAPVGTGAMPVSLSPLGHVYAFGGGFRRIDIDGSVPAWWPADGVGLGDSCSFQSMASRPDGSLLYLYGRATGPSVAALSSDGPPAAGWPAGGYALGSCFTPTGMWTDATGFVLIGRGCGSPVPLVARRFTASGIPSASWSSPTLTLSNAVATNLRTVHARDALDGFIVGWSNKSVYGDWTTDIRLKRLRGDGQLGAGAVTAVEPARASALALAAPAPNPAHGQTVLAFDLPRAMRASVALYDLAGRRVRTLVDGRLPAGRSAPRWDGRDDAGRALPAGVYLALLSTDEGNRTRRVALLP